MNPILSEEVRVVLDIGGEMYFWNTKEKIYWASHKDKMEEYLEEKYKWGQVIKKIDWIFHQKALQPLPKSHRISVSKAIFDWRPTNERLNKMKTIIQLSPHCPLCPDTEETNDHLCQCGRYASQTVHMEPLYTGWEKASPHGEGGV